MMHRTDTCNAYEGSLTSYEHRDVHLTRLEPGKDLEEAKRDM